MNENEKYEFNLSDPDSWAKMPKPYLTEAFVKRTNEIGGMNKHGKPRFKWSWGCSEEVFIESDGSIASGWYLKYMLCMTEKKCVGYKWTDEHGQEKSVKEMQDVPAGVLAAIPVYKFEQIGTPRWVLEEWHEAGDANGLYDAPGYYFHRWIVADEMPPNPDTNLKPYREPNEKDLEILAAYVQLTAKLTDEMIEEGVAADKAKAQEKAAKAHDERIAESAEDIYESFINAPKNLQGPRPPQAVIDKAWAQLNGRSK